MRDARRTHATRASARSSRRIFAIDRAISRARAPSADRALARARCAHAARDGVATNTYLAMD
jgi:hypothetical protein